MANLKKGFEYFSVDTDRFQDMKIKRLKKDMGCQGFAVYEYILNEIYRVKGCFLEWDESTAFDVAEYWGLKESLVQEIVRYCGAVGLFNKALLSGGIITSASIQGRYLEMCKRAKRSQFKIPEKCRIIPEESPKTPEVCHNSKVKYSIVKKEEGKEEEKPPSPPPSLQQILQDFYEKNQIHIDQILISKDDFFYLGMKVLTQWELSGWKKSFIKPGTDDFSALKFLRWIASEKDYQKRKETTNETSQTDKFQKRRGVDTAARNADDYTGSL